MNYLILKLSGFKSFFHLQELEYLLYRINLLLTALVFTLSTDTKRIIQKIKTKGLCSTTYVVALCKSMMAINFLLL